MGLGIDGTYKRPYTCWIYDSIFLTEKLLKASNSKGIKFFIHSHPFTTAPLASYEDYTLFASSKVKYGVVTNEFGTMIIKNKNLEKSFKNSEDIRLISFKIEKGVKKDFNKYLLDKGIDYKKMDKNQYRKKFQKFAKNNCEKYKNEYQKQLKDYMDITFIN